MTGATVTAPAASAMTADLRRSLRAYLVLMLCLVAVKLTLILAAASSPGFRSPSQAAVFSWPWLAGLTGFGLGGVWLCHRLRLPPIPLLVWLGSRVVTGGQIPGGPLLGGWRSRGGDRARHPRRPPSATGS